MRFTGVRRMQTPVEQVWEALHDGEVLRRAIPGCQGLAPLGPNAYSATLGARVGPVADTYRGSFTIHDRRLGSELGVRVDGRGRFGRLTLDLEVELAEGPAPRSAVLRYDAHACVSGFVARLGTPTLSVAGGHLTGCFFRDLERALRPVQGTTRVALAV